MEQEQWLQLKMLFLLGYNLKIVIQWGVLGGEYEPIFGWWGYSPHPPSRENPAVISNYICSRIILNFILYTKGYFKVVSRW